MVFCHPVARDSFCAALLITMKNNDCIWLGAVIGLAPETMRHWKCLGTGQTGVTGNVLLARSPKALAQDRPGEGTHGSTMAGGNDDAVGADQEALPRGASAQGRSAARNMNMKNIPLVISDPFSEQRR
jgi:hypothetical protein